MAHSLTVLLGRVTAASLAGVTNRFSCEKVIILTTDPECRTTLIVLIIIIISLCQKKKKAPLS